MSTLKKIPNVLDTEEYFQPNQTYVGNLVSYCDPLPHKKTKEFLESTFSVTDYFSNVEYTYALTEAQWILEQGRLCLANYSNIPDEYFLGSDQYCCADERDLRTPLSFSINIDDNLSSNTSGYGYNLNGTNYTPGFYDVILGQWTGYFEQPSGNNDTYVGYTVVFTS